MIVHESEPYNAEAPRAGLVPVITPIDSFYVRNHGPVPAADADWRLTVDGLVERPLELSVADVRDRWPAQTVTATMQCAGNRRIGLLDVRDIPGEAPWGPGATSTAQWTGVRLADVLEAAGVLDEARFVAFAAPDVSDLAEPPQGFGASIPLGKAMADEVLLAWAMNGEDLPAVHGGPLRVVVPGYIGARSVKWLQRITVQDTPSDNYFQAIAYRLLPVDADPSRPGEGLQLASTALNCDILQPEDGALVAGEAVGVAGYAYAGDDRTVVRVDVSVDGGRTWTQTCLEPAPSAWAWQHWHARLELPAGEHTIVARAWDSTGATQPEDPSHVWNPKGYINNSWARIRITAQA
jgi:sulfite oxidase